VPRAHVINNWNNLNHEDIGIIVRMQEGRHSDGFDGGVLSPCWDPTQQYFARLPSNSIAAKSNRNRESCFTTRRIEFSTVPIGHYSAAPLWR
jgi:hypothetical protein